MNYIGIPSLDAAGGQWVKLTEGIIITKFTQPDERHLQINNELLANQKLTFPIYTWSN